MASPFPGMDPYLEDPAFWADFHHRFLDDRCDAVAEAFPDNHDARLDETVNRPDRTLVAVLELLSSYYTYMYFDGTYVLRENDKEVPAKGYLTDLITQKAVSFMEGNKGQPFFLYVPHLAVHFPYKDASTEFLFDLDADIGERKNLAYQHPELVARLIQLHADWEREMDCSAPDLVVK